MWQRGLNTSLTSPFTGSTVTQKTPAGASAICDGGICIFNAALKDPTNTPSQVVRQRVVLGHIERDGYLYRQLSDRILDRETRLEYDSLPVIPYMFGPCVNLQLVIEETMNSSLLEATFYFETEVDTSQSLGLFVHEHRFGLYESMHLSRRSFGAAALRNNIIDRVRMKDCLGRQISITSLKRVNEPSVPWTGKCSQATSALCTNYEGNIEYCPGQGKWVLRQDLECCVGLLRGSYALLYSILCQLQHSTTITFNYISSCLICSVLIERYSERGVLTVVLPRSLTMYCILKPSSVRFKLVSSMNWREGVHGTCTGATMAQSESFSFEKSRSYTFVKKNVLKQILDQRGILFKKRATKLDMIKILQDYDAKNPDAANDEVLLDGEDDDDLDVSMEDASCLVTP